jgi:hypothetical protein
MITVETILKSATRKWCCMTNHRDCKKNNTTRASSGTGTSFLLTIPQDLSYPLVL